MDKVRVKIELEVELPKDFSETKVDMAIANLIEDLGGEVLCSEEFEILE